MPEITFEALALIDYADAWAIQQQRVAARAQDAINDTILLCEHPPVITAGRGVSPQAFEAFTASPLLPVLPVFHTERGGEGAINAAESRVRSYHTERGGGWTAHEPGQLVVYPILKMPVRQLRGFVNDLLCAVTYTLTDFGLDALQPPEGQTGVWVQTPSGELRKLASIGLASKSAGKGVAVTYHGLALNVCNSLETFSVIDPCGFAPGVMTSMHALLGSAVVEDVQPKFTEALTRVLQRALAEPT
ncbi:MAG: lipoyl(octanoyl) transferase LipB [Vampirovibrionales bacterium]|nr:lipoyl(octanoyl) transferase LipB [Vampirovibrionales bacterium]